MSLGVLVIIVIGLPLVLYAFQMFDRLVRAEYEMNRIDWETDGRPFGFFWKAPENTLFWSVWARSRLEFCLAVHDPFLDSRLT